jgi:hypothetical protein
MVRITDVKNFRRTTRGGLRLIAGPLALRSAETCRAVRTPEAGPRFA